MNDLKVLLVITDKLLDQRIVEVFNERGDITTSVPSLEQALAKIAVQSFDVLVVEGQTGRGLESLDLIRRARVSLPNMASIYLTGDITREVMMQAVRAHVFDIIHLPLEQMDLFTMSIERAAERIRLVRERDHLMDSLKTRNEELEISLSKLHEAYEKLMSQEELLEGDLNRAQLMQQNLLPESFPFVCDMEFFGYYSPSLRLGGDFFGYLPLGQDRLAVYLADVSGHGAGAAMVTVIFRELLHGQLLLHRGMDSMLENPSQTLQFLNRALLDENFDSPVHATMVYAVIDCAKGEINYCRAGHPPPVMCLGDGKLVRLNTGGPGVGLEKKPEYRSRLIPMAPGSACLFFSDGVTQAMAMPDEATAALSLGKTLRGVIGNSARRIAERVERAALGSGRNGISDDVSFLVIRRRREQDQVSHFGDMPSVKIVPARSSNHSAEIPKSRIEMGWEGGICMIRLVGEMTWQMGAAFQEVVEESIHAQAEIAYVDLTDCRSMDSTILGMINRYIDALVLSSSCERVERQLMELGIAKRLHKAETALPQVSTLVRISPEMTREQRVKMMLDAHESLVTISDDNKERFEPVIEMLRKKQPKD